MSASGKNAQAPHLPAQTVPAPSAMASHGGPALVWCPFPDADSAEKVADTLLDEGLVACANILGPMQARFAWRGERHQAEETGTLFKTDAVLLDRVIARLTALHPYQEPAVLGWRCDAAGPATAAWLGSLVR